MTIARRTQKQRRDQAEAALLNAAAELVVEQGVRSLTLARVGDARIRVYGETAIFTARQTNTAHYAGNRFDADEWVTDVFVRRDGRWLCVLSHITARSAPSSGTA